MIEMILNKQVWWVFISLTQVNRLFLWCVKVLLLRLLLPWFVLLVGRSSSGGGRFESISSSWQLWWSSLVYKKRCPPGFDWWMLLLLPLWSVAVNVEAEMDLLSGVSALMCPLTEGRSEGVLAVWRNPFQEKARRRACSDVNRALLSAPRLHCEAASSSNAAALLAGSLCLAEQGWLNVM